MISGNLVAGGYDGNGVGHDNLLCVEMAEVMLFTNASPK